MTSIKRECLSHKVKKVLMDRILSGEYQPGEALKELHLAREFSVGQTVIRESLLELRAEKLVKTIPYKGTFVREYTLEEFREIYQVRGILESGALRLCAGRVDVLREAERHQDALRKAAKEEDLDGITHHNSLFHRCFVAALGNGTLLKSWESFSIQTTMRALLMRKDWRVDLDPDKEHVPILEAMQAGNWGLAADKLYEHSLNVLPKETETK